VFSTGKVSWKRTELNLWIKTLIRWNKNCTSSGSPVLSEILRPRSTRNETDETLSGPCVSTATGWKSSVAHSSVYFRPFLSAACSASDGSCCMACSGQVWIGHCGADCDIPSQWFTSAPRNERAAVRAISVLVSQTSWLILYSNARYTKGAADTLAQGVMPHHSAGSMFTHETMRAPGINWTAAPTGVRTAKFRAQH